MTLVVSLCRTAARWRASLAVWLFVVGAPSSAATHDGVHWFTPDGGSFLVARAFASLSGNAIVDANCTFAAKRPLDRRSWWQQFAECAPQELPAPGRGSWTFDANDHAHVEHPNRAGSMDTFAFHRATFTPTSIEVTARIETRHGSDRPNPVAAGSMRGLLPVSVLPIERIVASDMRALTYGRARSGGAAFLRVPPGPDMRFRFTAAMRWEGRTVANRGGFEFLWKPNTIQWGRPRDHFSSALIEPGDARAGSLERFGVLSPGTYEFHWGVGNRVTNNDSLVELVLSMRFQPDECEGEDDSDKDGLPDVWELRAVKAASKRCVPTALLIPDSVLPITSVRQVYVEVAAMQPFTLDAAAIRPVKEAFAAQGIELHVTHPRTASPAPRCVDARGGDETIDLPEYCIKKQSPTYADLRRAYLEGRALDLKRRAPRHLTPEDLQDALDKVYHFAFIVDHVVDGSDNNKNGIADTPDGVTREKDIILAFGKLAGTNKDTVRGKRTISVEHRLPCGCVRGDPTRRRAVTFMHELGHTFGLMHWGGPVCDSEKPADCAGNKPNHLSVMNYAYGSVAGLAEFYCGSGREAAGPTFPIDYSHETLEELNEGSLDEAKGISIGSGSRWTVIQYPPPGAGEAPLVDRGAPTCRESPDARRYVLVETGNAVDWNLNGVPDESGVDRDIHRGKVGKGRGVLKGHDDWSQVDEALACRAYFEPAWSCGFPRRRSGPL